MTIPGWEGKILLLAIISVPPSRESLKIEASSKLITRMSSSYIQVFVLYSNIFKSTVFMDIFSTIHFEYMYFSTELIQQE